MAILQVFKILIYLNYLFQVKYNPYLDQAHSGAIESVNCMTQTPNIQTQGKPNNLSAIDKKIADGKAAEQATLHAPAPNQMPGQKVEPDTDTPIPAQQAGNGAART